jgi:hypothetical protein
MAGWSRGEGWQWIGQGGGWWSRGPRGGGSWTERWQGSPALRRSRGSCPVAVGALGGLGEHHKATVKLTAWWHSRTVVAERWHQGVAWRRTTQSEADGDGER